MAPETSLRAALLRAQMAFLLATLSGDRDVAAKAVAALDAHGLVLDAEIREIARDAAFLRDLSQRRGRH